MEKKMTVGTFGRSSYSVTQTKAASHFHLSKGLTLRQLELVPIVGALLMSLVNRTVRTLELQYQVWTANVIWTLNMN